MLFAFVLGLIALAFVAYFLHLFFQLNKAERRLQSTFNEVEAVMLQRYGGMKKRESREGTPAHKTDQKA